MDYRLVKCTDGTFDMIDNKDGDTMWYNISMDELAHAFANYWWQFNQDTTSPDQRAYVRFEKA